jgi:homocysteine S-methyltransferase
MGVLPAAFLLEREVGVETVMHYTCRDRNMLGMLSDLLGAAAAGIRNILIITGDPPAMGPYPDATAVFDIDAIGLTNVVHRLNHGLDPGGSTIGEPTRYVIGVALNQGAVDLDKEIERYGWKVEAGAEFAVTQPVFDVPQLEQFFERTKQWNVPALAGIWPLTSLRNAEFLANEVPGVHVPPEVLDRMRGAQAHGSDAARAEGTAIALEVYERVRPLVHGVQISVPYGRVETALSFLDATASSRAPT